MDAPEKPKDVSSAEIVAIYRSAIPQLSGDILSERLIGEPGRERAAAFINKYNYPLVTRKISLCAGYFLSEATRLLSSGLYDSCISFASGFSLLTYNIATKNKAQADIKYFDTDFPHMVEDRNQRINNIANLLDRDVLKIMQSKAFDIEKAYQQNLNLKEVFPGCKRPIFIADGVSYFLSEGCVHWLFEQMGSYDTSTAMLYYWPENMLQTSSLFKAVFADLNQGMILEELKSFWDDATLAAFKKQFPYTADWSLAEVEKMLIKQNHSDLSPLLIDPNQYFPIRLISGEKKR